MLIKHLNEYLKPETTMLLDEMFDGVYIVDRKRQILFWNLGAEKITGYARGQMVNLLCHEGPLQHQDAQACRLCEHGCPALRAMEKNQEIVDVVYLKTSQAQYIPVETHIHPLVDSSNQVIGALEVFRDIRVWKQMEALSAEKDRLMGVLAHDLRNPLAVILSYGKLLSGHADKRIREMAAPIVRKGVFANNLVNTLLDAKAVESGKVEIHPALLNLTPVLRPIVDAFKHMAYKKQIDLVYVDSPLPLTLWTDAARFEEIMNNLISNAMKYSQPNTTIEVRVEKPNMGVRILVCDQGLGMSEEDQKNMFLAFYKGSNKPTAGESSHGLGLYIVKKLVDLLKAKIEVSSQVGQGTIMTLVFPDAEGVVV